MDSVLADVTFYLCSAVVLLAARGVVCSRHLLHSALWLAVCFLGIGCLYIFLAADFLGAMQFLVYAGGVAVLIVLGSMLTQQPDCEADGIGQKHRFSAGGIAAGFAGVLLTGILVTPWTVQNFSLPDTVGALAELMLTQYILSFEAAAILLLAATIGVIVLARGANEA